MNVGILDVETTTRNDGNPFDESNVLCYVGIYLNQHYYLFDVEYSEQPYGETLHQIQELLDQCDLLVGFNIKFDLHWLRRYGITIKCPIWDCQYVEYVLSGQLVAMPSLNDTAEKHGLGKKVDKIAEYWNRGVDTRQIPRQELEEYLTQDLTLTDKVFNIQKNALQVPDKLQMKRIVWYGCQDILVTEEMEWNGLKYDIEKSKSIGDKILSEIASLDNLLYSLVPHKFINFGSHEHISAILYGGIAKYKVRELVTKTLKKGQVISREQTVAKGHLFPELIKPPRGAKLKKEGYFATDEGTLKKLPAKGIAKQIITALLERAKLDKKVGTYFHGIPKMYEEMGWKNNVIHGQLVHCVARTGRLASRKPNQQNLDEEVRQCIISRFLKDPQLILKAV